MVSYRSQLVCVNGEVLVLMGLMLRWLGDALVLYCGRGVWRCNGTTIKLIDLYCVCCCCWLLFWDFVADVFVSA